MAETEALEEAALKEMQAAAATAMKSAQAAATAFKEAEVMATAMMNLSGTVNQWLQVASTATKKRREIESQSASLVKQMNSRIQELEKRMEERTETLLKDLEEEMKKRGTVVQTKPIADNQAKPSLQGRPTDNAGTSNGVKRDRQSSADSLSSSATPSKHQRTSQNVTPAAHFSVVTKQTSPFSPPLLSIPSRLNPNQSSLQTAVKYGRMDDVLNYLELGVDPNFRDVEAKTLLHVAANSARGKILKVLLTIGRMQIDAVDSAGQTALHVASSKPNGVSCVAILLHYKADINKRDKKGDTPLHCAARNGHKKIVEKLVEMGADLNILNNDGETPLRIANTDEVRHLLHSQILSTSSSYKPSDPCFLVSTAIASAKKTGVECDEIFLD